MSKQEPRRLEDLVGKSKASFRDLGGLLDIRPEKGPEPVPRDAGVRRAIISGVGPYGQGYQIEESLPAVQRVKNPLPIPTECHYCGGSVRLLEHSQFYRSGRNYGSWPYLYACQGCDASVGIHPGTLIPLGTLADSELKDARQRNKTVFLLAQEILFNDDRGAAYRWLAHKMGIEVESCHWGWFDLDQCEKAGSICSRAVNDHRL